MTVVRNTDFSPVPRVEVGGRQTGEGHYLTYRKILQLALWRRGFGGVKVKDEAESPAEGMVLSRTEATGWRDTWYVGRGVELEITGFSLRV